MKENNLWLVSKNKVLFSLFLLILFPGLTTVPAIIRADQITNVEVLELKPQSLKVHSDFLGYLAPAHRVKVSSEINGIIEQANFEVGDSIKKDQLLVKISTEELQLDKNLAKSTSELSKSEYKWEKQLYSKRFFADGVLNTKKGLVKNLNTESLIIARDLARADYQLALVEFKRENQLFKQKISNQQAYDKAKNSLKSARAKLDLAELDLAKVQIKASASLEAARTKSEIDSYRLKLAKIKLNKSLIKAPISGVIKTKLIEQGEYLKSGDQLLEIIDISHVLAIINIPEQEMRFIRQGKLVKVQLDAYPGKEFIGRIKNVGLEANLDNRSFPIEVELKNPGRELLPGMLARVKVNTISKFKQLLIPRDSIIEREDTRFVYLAKNGKSVKKEVVLGVSTKSQVQVLSGLKFGDQLIIKGHQLIRDQEVVKILNLSESKTPKNKLINELKEKKDLKQKKLADMIQSETKELPLDKELNKDNKTGEELLLATTKTKINKEPLLATTNLQHQGKDNKIHFLSTNWKIILILLGIISLLIYFTLMIQRFRYRKTKIEKNLNKLGLEDNEIWTK